MTTDARIRSVNQATWISAFTNALLAALKISIGLIGNSQALVADGVHSATDLISDFFVWFATRIGVRHADKDHPYGHHRIETVATILISLLLIIIAAEIGFHSILKWQHSNEFHAPSDLVILIALLSVFANEGLYQYMSRLSQRIHSELLHSNAWHNRSDAFSSLIVVLTTIGAMLGWYWLDAIGALIIALWIFYIAINMSIKSVRELVDTSVNDETIEHMQAIIKQTPGVQALHLLRTRTHAGFILADVHIIVSPTISVSEGHYIGDQVQIQLKNKVDKLIDITVHIDPEDDEACHPSSHLPSREHLQKLFQQHLTDLPHHLQCYNLQIHYLNGKIMLELYFPSEVLDTTSLVTLKQQYSSILMTLKSVSQIKIYCFNAKEST